VSGRELTGGATLRSGIFSPIALHHFVRPNSALLNRETIKRLLAFPTDTNIIWKSHDDSIAQRSAIDQARHEKTVTGTGHQERRRPGQDDSEKGKVAVDL
jgi:hypothetical protein